MLFYIAMSSLAQELRMGMAKKVNGKDYYVPVELESNFLIDVNDNVKVYQIII